MSLAPGTRLGPFEIVSLLGAGGMGEVYRAHDSRLQRDVAIKVLLPEFTDNADLKQRFEREARAISSLQHPHICTLFDIGEYNGGAFLVMEFLEGETLASRLHRGAMPLSEIIKVASQVADALERAHRSGIVHRDLKPGNIMLTASGAKLMDFGLAKPLGKAAGASNTAAPLLSAARTTSGPSPLSPLTSVGTIVGTVQYMAPEQIEGREADARSDVFAFGAVLYEMATAKRAFAGKSQLTVASAILEKDPEPISSITPSAPPAFERIVNTCLAKDPEDRFQAARDVAIQLKWIGESKPLPKPAFEGLLYRTPLLALFALLLVVVAAAVYWLMPMKRDALQIRATLDLPDGVTLDSVGDYGGMPVLSPDGKTLVFAAHAAKNQRCLWVRPLNEAQPRRLDGTEGSSHPFWSADSATIGFFRDGKLARIPAAGGPVTVLAPALNSRGGTWLNDNTILYTPDFQSPIVSVPTTGGTPVPVTKLDLSKHSTHRWPWALPDGKHFLYLATSHNQAGSAAQNGIYFASIDGGEPKFVVTSDSGAQYANGYLLYHQGNNLLAQPFDPSNGTLSGAPLAVFESVRNDVGVWRAQFSISQTGILIYQEGSAETAGSRLLWYDRTGKQVGQVGDHGNFLDPRLSPDGRRVAASFGEPNRDIWIFDVATGSHMRLTFAQGTGGARVQPSWSNDGKEIMYFTSYGGGDSGVAYIKPANGSGAERIAIKLQPGAPHYPSWTPDGKNYVFMHTAAPAFGSNAIAMQAVSGGDYKVIVQPAVPQSTINHHRVSPNGRWIAYSSDESGGRELYVASFPSGEGKWQISNGGGDYPVWRGDSKELFYMQPSGAVYAAEIDESDGDLKISSTQRLFLSYPAAVGYTFDATRDGQRFLVNSSVEPNTPGTIRLVTNWTSGIKKQ